MTKLKIRQLYLTNCISNVEQQNICGGSVAETILDDYATGQSNLSQSGSTVRFTDANGNPNGALISKNGSDYYIKDGVIEKVDNGNSEASLNVTAAFL